MTDTFELARIEYPMEPIDIIDWYKLGVPDQLDEHKFRGIEVFVSPSRNRVAAVEALPDEYQAILCEATGIAYEEGQFIEKVTKPYREQASDAVRKLMRAA